MLAREQVIVIRLIATLIVMFARQDYLEPVAGETTNVTVITAVVMFVVVRELNAPLVQIVHRGIVMMESVNHIIVLPKTIAMDTAAAPGKIHVRVPQIIMELVVQLTA